MTSFVKCYSLVSFFRPDWSTAQKTLGDGNFLKRLLDFDKVSQLTCKNIYLVSQKNARRLICCRINMTVLTRSAFIFSGSSYFNLKFGIKQSEIG